jgi:hypothetical protein
VWLLTAQSVELSLTAGIAQLLRDIFPFRPITLSPSWLTSTVVSLAQQMYDSRDFNAMPILADALQDAGCDNALQTGLMKREFPFQDYHLQAAYLSRVISLFYC